MTKLINIDENDLFQLISSYAEAKNLSEAIIEKDFWNCYFLDYLFNRSQYKDYFIFKGGTSLSKGYDLINRYSEDLDIVLDSKILGVNLNEKSKTIHSRNQKEKFIDEINEKAVNFIDQKLIPEMKKECEKEINKKITFKLEKEKLAFFISYPRMSKYDYISPTIKIEMSSLSATIPFDIKKVGPYINDILIDEYKASFNVKCLAPKRTFWEKALILHQEANRIDGKFPSRYSRHYYDLYQIYNSNIWKDILNDSNILDDVRKFTISFYNRSWANFEDAKPGTFKLVPNHKYLNELKKDYELMSQMIFGTKPLFEDVIKTIEKMEREINEI